MDGARPYPYKKDIAERVHSVVVGSGFGGIAAALRMRAKGHQVTLIELSLIHISEPTRPY